MEMKMLHKLEVIVAIAIPLAQWGAIVALAVYAPVWIIPFVLLMTLF
jgi:hypothetical protein